MAYDTSSAPGAPPPPPADPPGTVGALVWGVVGVTVLPLIGSIVAIVMGGNARDRAAAMGRPEPSMALAGRVLGWVGLALVLIPLVIVLVVGLIAGIVFLGQ